MAAKERKCGICQKPGHTRQKCPDRERWSAHAGDEWPNVFTDATVQAASADTAAALADLEAAPVPVLKRATTKDPLRGSVTEKADAVWANRRRDLYTLKKREDTKDPEVDHILEIQFLRLALDHASHKAQTQPSGAEVKQLHSKVNGLLNLNVTTHALNQKKRGPFTSWCNNEKKETARPLSLYQFAVTSFADYDQFAKHWALIEGAVVRAYDDVLTDLCADLQPASQPVVAEFCVNSLPDLFARLKVDT